MSAGLRSASGEVGFAGVLVLKVTRFADHPLVMCARCAGDGAVPLQRRQIVCGSGLIGELDENLLSRRWGALGWAVLR
jgi:hypothetical protein